MYSLLPENYIEALKREYRFRLIVAYLFFFIVTFAIGLLALLPTYILLGVQSKGVDSDLEILQKEAAAGGTAKVEADAIATKGLIDGLKNHQDSIVFSKVIESVVSHRGGYVAVQGMEIARDTASTTLIKVSGVAPLRDSLVAFKKSLEKDPNMAKVDLPVGDLAKSKDVHFTMTLHMKW